MRNIERMVAMRSLKVLAPIVAGTCILIAVLYHRSVYTDRVVARTVDGSGSHQVRLLSRSHTIDRIYMSMQGPFSTHKAVRLLDTAQRELLWLTGIRAKLVGQNGKDTISREFFCHSNLTFDLSQLAPDRVVEDGPFTRTTDYRLFTLIPGSLEVQLPDGFGLPVYSDEPLDYLSMSLNMNQTTGSRQVRFDTTLEFVRDSSMATEAARMRPLFRRAVYGYEPLGKASHHRTCTDGTQPGAACGPFIVQGASNHFLESLGRTNTVHWLIPPGRYVSEVPVTTQLDLPEDTTVHFVTAHLHPYGKSISLLDATTGQTVFQIGSRDWTDRIGVDRMEQLSLPEGVPLYRDHEYRLVTIYENTTAEPIDAMAILYLYALDRRFESTMPSAMQVASRQ